MKEIIEVKADKAPQALGPYSQAVIAGDFVFCSGQIAFGGDIKEQTRQVIQNLRAVLISAESDLDRVVKSDVYLKSIDDFQAMNEVYGEYFNSDPAPARVTVEVSRLPKDVLLEISCIAYKK